MTPMERRKSSTLAWAARRAEFRSTCFMHAPFSAIKAEEFAVAAKAEQLACCLHVPVMAS